MRTFFFIFIISYETCLGQAPSNYVLKGEITNSPNSYWVTLFHRTDDGKAIIDSCQLQDNKFIFKGNIDHATRFRLRGNIQSYEHDDPNSVDIFLDADKEATAKMEYGKLKEIKLINSISHQQYEASQTAPNQNQYIIENPSSQVSAFVLQNLIDNISLDSLQLLYDKLEGKVKNSYYGLQVGKLIENKRGSNIGIMAKEFGKRTYAGTSIKLSDFNGKYVLLDFWASWCGPCRAKSSDLIKIYDTYHNKGLEIIGIADDDSSIPKWEKAIEKDGLVWHQILRGYKPKKLHSTTDVSEIYAVTLLPTYILIDPEGIIIQRFTGSESVDSLKMILQSIF